MAVRKPRATFREAPENTVEPERWPYSVVSRVLTIQSDGSVRIPSGLVRMIASPGEEVIVTFLSDGHLEVESPAGRLEPSRLAAGSQVYETGEDFVAALQARMKTLR